MSMMQSYISLFVLQLAGRYLGEDAMAVCVCVFLPSDTTRGNVEALHAGQEEVAVRQNLRRTDGESTCLRLHASHFRKMCMFLQAFCRIRHDAHVLV